MNYRTEKRNNTYSKQINIENIKRQIYNSVEETWYKSKNRQIEYKRVAKKLRKLLWKYQIAKNPVMIPVLILKMKVYIKEKCPEYSNRLI